MSDHKRSIPLKLHMTCVSCAGRRNFVPAGKYPEEPGAAYECRDCGHAAYLDLDHGQQ